jgi:hypothetical protein
MEDYPRNLGDFEARFATRAGLPGLPVSASLA